MMRISSARPDNLDEEFKKVIDLSLYVLGSLGFENFTSQVSVRDPEQPEKYIGEPAIWDQAEQAIINAAEAKGLNYEVVNGEAAFYGPKLDFMVRMPSDANGSWAPYRWIITCPNALN